jgi:hypothetical protein
MNTAPKPVNCHIGSFQRPLQEAWLETNGFSRGMILFAIPDYGILFKCRASGSLLDLEFGAFFALLRFVRTSLGKEKIKAVRVHSSNPEFVFSVLNEGPKLKARRRRHKKLKQYRQHLEIQIALVPPLRNKTRVAPTDFPSTPEGQAAPLKARRGGQAKALFRPIQKGISL